MVAAPPPTDAKVIAGIILGVASMLLLSVAALFLATGTAHAYDKYSAPLKGRFGVTGARALCPARTCPLFLRGNITLGYGGASQGEKRPAAVTLQQKVGVPRGDKDAARSASLKPRRCPRASAACGCVHVQQAK
jgi:hypothetical protein